MRASELHAFVVPVDASAVPRARTTDDGRRTTAIAGCAIP
jgi:hypothetical protein